MSMLGLFGLVVALVAAAISAVMLLAGHILAKRGRETAAETASWAGAVASILAAIALTFCCGILVFAFMTEDVTLRYVLENQSHAEGVSGILYRLSGLWAGREGSLLFWGDRKSVV